MFADRRLATTPRPPRDLVDFLERRLTEELALLWARDDARGAGDGPGLAAQLAVLDDVLVVLASGRLPASPDLRVLLYAYGRHPGYDPAWTTYC